MSLQYPDKPKPFVMNNNLHCELPCKRKFNRSLWAKKGDIKDLTLLIEIAFLTHWAAYYQQLLQFAYSTEGALHDQLRLTHFIAPRATCKQCWTCLVF